MGEISSQYTPYKINANGAKNALWKVQYDKMSCLYRTLYSAKIVVFYARNSKKQLFFDFFYKKTAKVFVLQKKDVPLHRI
jgi:hypothetical protein